jgi:hypothetical protein
MSSARPNDVKIELALAPTTSAMFKAWHIPSHQAHKDVMDILPNGNLSLFTSRYLVDQLNATFCSLRILNPITAKVKNINLPIDSDKLIFIEGHLFLSDKKNSLLLNLTDYTQKQIKLQFDTKRMFPLSKTTVAHIVSPVKNTNATKDDKATNDVISIVEVHDTTKIAVDQPSLLYQLKLPNVRSETVASIVQLERYLVLSLDTGFVVALPEVDGKFRAEMPFVIALTQEAEDGKERQALKNLQLTALKDNRVLCYFYDRKTMQTKLHLLNSDTFVPKSRRKKHPESSLVGEYNNRCATVMNDQTILFINSVAMHFINTDVMESNFIDNESKKVSKSIVLFKGTLDHLASNDDNIFMMYQRENKQKYIVGFEKKAYCADEKAEISTNVVSQATNPHALFKETFSALNSLPAITVTEENTNSVDKPCCTIM